MPESAYGPTNNCIGIGKILEGRGHRVVFAAEASWRGRLEPLGFEEDLVDLGPTGRGRPGRRTVLDRLHHGDGAGVPQADDRAARHVHPTGVGVADRRSEVLRAATPGDPGPRAARRNRRGQRERLPGPPHPRRALGADHELQPARTEGSRHPADVQRLPDRRPERVGGVPRRVRPDPPRSLVRLQRLDARAGGTRPPRPRVHPRIGAPEPVRVPRCRRLSPRAAARIRVAPPRVIGP